MKEALKLALEALEYWDVHGKLHQPTEEAITAIKAAMAQDELVAKYSDIVSDGGLDPRNKFDAPPQRTWVGLTEVEKGELWGRDTVIPFSYADAIESKLKEKNYDK